MLAEGRTYVAEYGTQMHILQSQTITNNGNASVCVPTDYERQIF